MADNLTNRARERGVPADWVELRHPETGGTHKSHPGAVSHWEDRGWVRVDQSAQTDAQATATNTEKAPAPAPKRAAGGQEG